VKVDQYALVVEAPIPQEAYIHSKILVAAKEQVHISIHGDEIQRLGENRRYITN